MAGSDDDWAGNSVPWNPEFPVFEPSHNLLLEAGPWAVPYSDFTPPANPFALEMRSETIEQLVGGDALRRGESERVEAGRSEENSDAVAGRDRVRVQGTLHEHTGHGLAAQAAHLHTTVDGRLDVHAGKEDTVLLAGHMKDVWDGGTATVAAMTDDLVAGGGVRVTAPLDLWVHGLMGVEERIGTCTADAVLMELGATHYEREYGPGVHAVGLAVYNGSLYLSNRSSFRPLMRVSSGVRNLIAGGGGGGAGDAPDGSPPPAPAAAGAGAEAASETLCAATDGARTVEAVVEAGARSDDLTGTRRFSNATDAVRSEDLAAMNQAPAAQLDDLPDSLRRAGDETGEQPGTGSPSSAGSDSRVPQEGVERSDTQVDSLDEFRHTFETMLAAESGDTSLFARSDDPSGFSRSPDSAEQLAVLQRGDMNTPSLESIDSPISSGMDDVDGSSDMSRAGSPVSERDRTPTGSPDSPDWEDNFIALTFALDDSQYAGNRTAVDAYQAAVDAITDKVLTTFLRLGGDGEVLDMIHTKINQAMTARRILAQMAETALDAGQSRRGDKIFTALQEIDHHTYQTLDGAGLIDSASALDTHDPFWALDARVGPTMNEPATGGNAAVNPGRLETFEPSHGVVGGDSRGITQDSSFASNTDVGAGLHSEPDHTPPPLPAKMVDRVVDSDGRVILRKDAFEQVVNKVISLRVQDADGREVAKGAYKLEVPGYYIGVVGNLLPRDPDASGLADLAQVDETQVGLAGRGLFPRDSDASGLADLAQVDETQVGLASRGGPPAANLGERHVSFGPNTVHKFEKGPDEYYYPFPRRGHLLQRWVSQGFTIEDVHGMYHRFLEASKSREVTPKTPQWQAMFDLLATIGSRVDETDPARRLSFTDVEASALEDLLSLMDSNWERLRLMDIGRIF